MWHFFSYKEHNWHWDYALWYNVDDIQIDPEYHVIYISMFDPTVTEIETFWKNFVNAWGTNVSAPCVAWASAMMLLTMRDKNISWH